MRPSLQHLILRECRVGDDIAREIIRKIRDNPDSRLKSLDFYGNELSNELTEDISIFVEENKTLEFLGLSKNSLNSDEFLGKLFNSIGEIPLSEQEYEQHKLKEKARDEVV